MDELQETGKEVALADLADADEMNARQGLGDEKEGMAEISRRHDEFGEIARGVVGDNRTISE